MDEAQRAGAWLLNRKLKKSGSGIWSTQNHEKQRFSPKNLGFKEFLGTKNKVFDGFGCSGRRFHGSFLGFPLFSKVSLGISSISIEFHWGLYGFSSASMSSFYKELGSPCSLSSTIASYGLWVGEKKVSTKTSW